MAEKVSRRGSGGQGLSHRAAGRWADRILGAAVLFGAASPSGGAARADTLRFWVSHEFYILGLPVLSLESAGMVDNGHYRLATADSTLGLLDLIVDYSGRGESEGAVERESARPRFFRIHARWRGDDRRTALEYGADGPARAYLVPPPEQDDRDPVPPALQAGTLDPLSAYVLLGALDAGETPCRRSVPIFDGRQRYDLRLDYLGTETLEKTVDGAYGGEAVKCRVSVERIAGFMKRFADDPPRPPSTLWLARLADGRLLVPVKLEAETRWGRLTGYATSIAVEAARWAAR